MKRISLLTAILLVAVITALAQTPTTATTPAINQAPGSPMITPSTTTGPTTPIITLGTVSPSPTGATNATPGNQAGATNSTLQPTITGGAAPQTVFTTPVTENLPNSTESYFSASNSPAGGRDLLFGSSDSAWSISGTTVSVAEAARQARAAKVAHKPRLFTNNDLARLRSNAPVSVVGNTSTPETGAPVTNEQTMPASDVVAPSESTTPATPQTSQPATQSPGAQAPKSPFRAKPSPITQPR